MEFIIDLDETISVGDGSRNLKEGSRKIIKSEGVDRANRDNPFVM